MNKKKVFTLMIIAVLVISFGSAAWAGSLKLKMASAFPSTLPLLDSGKNFAEQVTKISNGAIKIKYHEPGQLMPAFDVHESVSRGVVQIGYTSALYLQGKIPAASFFAAVPFGLEATELFSWLLVGGGLELYQEMYDKNGFNVVVLPAYVAAQETGGWFTKPIKSIADFKKMKVRMPGLGGAVLADIGVSVTTISLGETFQAMEKGVVDGADVGQPIMDDKIGVWKVAKYNYFPGWHQPGNCTEIIINKDVWNKLSDSQKQLLKTVSLASVAMGFAKSQGLETDILLKNEKKHGVKNMKYPEEVLQELKKAWNAYVAKKAAADPFLKKVWDSQQSFRKKYRYWNDLTVNTMPKD